MILDNQRAMVIKPVIPPILKNKISFFSNCVLKASEITYFNQALQCVAKGLEQDGIDLPSYYTLNVFFTEDGSISFHENDERNNGLQIYMVIYRMNKIRKINSCAFTIFVYIEELVHYFWRIYDETAIKYKVLELTNYVIPSLTIDDVKGWGLNGL